MSQDQLMQLFKKLGVMYWHDLLSFKACTAIGEDANDMMMSAAKDSTGFEVVTRLGLIKPAVNGVCEV